MKTHSSRLEEFISDHTSFIGAVCTVYIAVSLLLSARSWFGISRGAHVGQYSCFLFLFFHPFLSLYVLFPSFFSTNSLFFVPGHYYLFRLLHHSPVLSPSIHPPCCLTGRVCCFYPSDIGSLLRARPGNSEFSLMDPVGPAPDPPCSLCKLQPVQRTCSTDGHSHSATHLHTRTDTH